MNVDEG
jgi:hypothetical protein